MSDLRSLPQMLNRLTLSLRREHSPAPIIGAAIAVFVLFAFLSPDTFPTGANMTSLGFQVPETAILGLAVMLSMVVAGIDLSVVAIADLAGVAMVQYYHAMDVTEPGHGGPVVVIVGILIALVVGAVCGAINGLLVGKLRITAILATLATMELYGGLALAWTGGNVLSDVPKTILDVGNSSPLGIPFPAILFVICAILVALFLNGSRFGVRSVLVGANPKAAGLSGIREPRIQIGIYTASGLLAAAAGILFVGRTAGATPDYGAGSYVLLAVVIAVLGGVDYTGGFGTVIGVTLAAVVLSMIQSGFVSLSLDQFFYEAAQGGILIVVLAVGAIGRGDIRWLSRLRMRGRRRTDVAAGPPSGDGDGADPVTADHVS